MTDSIIKTRITQVRLYQEGILLIEFIDEYEVDVEDIHEIRNALLSISRETPSKILVIPGRYGSITKDARELDMFRISDDQLFLGVAIVTKQLHQKLLGTLYFKFKPKAYPHKLFKSKEKALAWLDKVG